MAGTDHALATVRSTGLLERFADSTGLHGDELCSPHSFRGYAIKALYARMKPPKEDDLDNESLRSGYMIGRVMDPSKITTLRELFELDRTTRGELALLQSGPPVELTIEEASDMCDPATATFVAYDRASEVLVGHVSLHRTTTFPRGRSAEVDMVVTRPGHERQGIAQAMMEEVIWFADREWHCRKLYLTSNPKRKAAHTLYLKLGFTHRHSGCFELVLPWTRPEGL